MSLIIISPFLLRDFDECGLQIFLLLVLSAAGFAFARREPVIAGVLLAAGATYKATPLLFLPLLLWKREWKGAAAMVVSTLALNVLLPVAYLGWSQTLAENRNWIAVSTRILSDSEGAYPSSQTFEPPKVQNLGLRACWRGTSNPIPRDIRSTSTIPCSFNSEDYRLTPPRPLQPY